MIIPDVEYNHQRNMEHARHPSIHHTPIFNINILPRPVLKRLARRLGSTMNKSVDNLRRFCVEYYHSVRSAHLDMLIYIRDVETTQQQPIHVQDERNTSEVVRRVLANISNSNRRDSIANNENTQPVDTTTVLHRPSYLTNNQRNINRVVPPGNTFPNDDVIPIDEIFRFNNFIANGSLQQPQPQPQQPKVVLQLIKNLDTGKDECTKNNCCICLNKEIYITTNCRHEFCNCILQHISKNGVSCPMCRQRIYELNYHDNNYLDTTVKMLPLLPVPLQNLFYTEESDSDA